MNPAKMRISWPEDDQLRSVPLLQATSSTTAVTVDASVRETIWNVSLASLAEDLLIALEVRRRDARDSGERLALDDFIREHGLDPEDFSA